MPYAVSSKRNSRKARREINVRQTKFPKGYVSTIDNSRRPLDSLSDLTNIEIVQDSIMRPRPPLVLYGTQPANTVIGRALAKYNGSRRVYFMQNVSGVGKLYRQTDGGSMTLVGGSYDDEAWAMGVQSKSKLYIFNSVDKLSYVDLSSNSVVTYTSLSTPTISSVTKTGMTGTTVTHYYRVSASNEVGESIASASSNVTSGKNRENWIENTDYTTVTWGAVTNADTYTIYYSTDNITFLELYSVPASQTSWNDYGTLATNPFKLAPEGNSTEGPVFTWMYVDSKNSQVFGITSDSKLYYSAPGATSANSSADFSPYNGGGFVTIDEGSDTSLNFIDGFRTGKGDPVVTVSARGAAGKGKLFHVSFETLTVGDQTIVYPSVIEANGNAATYAPRATLKERDALWYPTGTDFKSTGTSQNIVNILTTNSISTGIQPDVERLSLANLHKAVGLAYQDRLFFALPVGSSENNEIWYIDLSRKNLWVLRWTVSAKDMWLYEDNSGATHHCVLVDNEILEFTRAGGQTHVDNDVPWRSRVAFESMVWDDSGIILGSIRNQFFKFLFPKGLITVNAIGLSRKGVEQSAGTDTFTVETTPTQYGVWMYGEHMYGDPIQSVNTFGKSVAVLRLKPRGLLAQLSWEVVADTAGSDYLLSTVTTRGFALDNLVLKA